MTRTYKATGINLKAIPIGEADRLVTILTKEFGLIKVVAPGARKHNSKLSGRSQLFVVNELLVAKGRSLDKITQAETIKSYGGLSRNLQKLAVSQYLAELALCLSLSEQPQEEMYQVLNENLTQLEQLTIEAAISAHLAQGIFDLLTIAGIAPLIEGCCITQKVITPRHNQIGFSFEAGGLIDLKAIDTTQEIVRINQKLAAEEISCLQLLRHQTIREYNPDKLSAQAWINIQRLMRDYAQYHCTQSLQSGKLVDSCTI